MHHAHHSRVVLFLIVLLTVGIGPAALAAPKLQQFAVRADDGLTLALWAREVAQPKGVIVLVHGRTWSALPDFDLQVPGDQRSVMQSLNARGYSAFALDMRGYGKTPRDATGWLLVFPAEPPEPARAGNTREAAASDFISPQVAPKKMIDAYVAAALAADPVRVDWRNQQAEFQALDPSQVTVPTLLMHGERDPVAPMDAQARLFVGLGTADKQWVVLKGGDHAALIEDTHAAFIAAIVAFVSRPTLH
jgi:alpha-beta hydrolase superfamily lysophospholipase